MICTRTRRRHRRTQYWCHACNAWVRGKLWSGPVTEVVCDNCGLTLDDDLFGLAEAEIPSEEEQWDYSEQ